jgi:vancomycin resistance protein YoaR
VLVWWLAVAAVLFGLFIGGGLALLPRDGRMAQGIVVDRIDLSGLTRTEASNLLEAAATATTDTVVTLAAGEHTVTVSLRALGIRADSAHALAEAYAVGRRGPLPARVVNAARARWGHLALSPVVTLDETSARAVLESFGRKIDQRPTDATATWNGSAVVRAPGHPGAKLDVPDSLKKIKAVVLGGVVRSAVPPQVALPYLEKMPHVTTAMLEAVDSVLGAFTTSFASSTSNRAKNVETAAKAINHVVLLPGETFSFNETVGPRELKNGYRIAPVIVDGQLEPGIGGGVCQVSTTLYNAVLLANMAIVSRSHHSLPSHYVAPGLDATVAYGAVDFKFRNATDAPVIIESNSAGRRLQIRLLGKGPAPTVHIVRSNIANLPGRTITKPDPTLPKGVRVLAKKGKLGKAVTVTRIVGDGPDAQSEQLSKDRYMGEPTIVRLGTGPAKASGQAEMPESNTPPEALSPQ